jgi:hypothetical protein
MNLPGEAPYFRIATLETIDDEMLLWTPGKNNGSEMGEMQAIAPLKQALTVCVEGLTGQAKPFA